jgi:signal transduction histidine kinase
MSEDAPLGELGRRLIANRAEITDEWRRRVAALPGLARLPTSALVDHLPEFLYELAQTSDGDSEAARRACERLINGHALQRLGFGVDLATLLEEYAVLRQVILAHLLDAVPADCQREELLMLDRALDLALVGSVRTFAARRDELREQFVGMLAHDLRSPLQALTIGAEKILRQAACGVPGHERAAAAIRRSAERMRRLISDVIDFARGQLGGGIPAVPVTCDMGEVCREVVDEARVTHPARELSVVASGDLIGSWDRDRLLQALTNLVSNALLHGDDPIELRAFEGSDRQSVTTEVHNAGPPIPDDVMPTLFDPFHRGKAAKPGGLGLGLFIVQQIALAHGAECRVRSSAGEGTTFSIRWPRAPLTEVPRPYQSAAR